jgi:hypothetical protein
MGLSIPIDPEIKIASFHPGIADGTARILWTLADDEPPLTSELPGQVSQVRFITRPKSRTKRATT